MFSPGQSLCCLRPAVSAARAHRLMLLRRASSSAAGADAPSEAAPEPRAQPEAPDVRTDVSRLRKWHHRKYHHQPPLVDEETQHLRQLRVQRRLWALYGRQSGINPAIGWPVKEEWEDKMEYEALAYPDTLQEMVAKFRAEQLAKQAAIDERMRAIDANLANLEKWKREIINKKKKKEEQIRVAEEKRARMIAEVKDIVGFRVDPKDEKFKKVLEEKELEEKKLLKEAKKREKQRRQLEQLRQMTEQAAAAAGISIGGSTQDSTAAETSAAAADAAQNGDRPAALSPDK